MLHSDKNPRPAHPDQQRPTWTAATLKALAQASALGIPVSLPFPVRKAEERR